MHWKISYCRRTGEDIWTSWSLLNLLLTAKSQRPSSQGCSRESKGEAVWKLSRLSALFPLAMRTGNRLKQSILSYTTGPGSKCSLATIWEPRGRFYGGGDCWAGSAERQPFRLMDIRRWRAGGQTRRPTASDHSVGSRNHNSQQTEVETHTVQGKACAVVLFGMFLFIPLNMPEHSSFELLLWGRGRLTTIWAADHRHRPQLAVQQPKWTPVRTCNVTDLIGYTDWWSTWAGLSVWNIFCAPPNFPTNVSKILRASCAAGHSSNMILTWYAARPPADSGGSRIWQLGKWGGRWVTTSTYKHEGQLRYIKCS